MDFSDLYRRHAGALYQLSLRLLRDPDRAADAVQDAFAKAFAARESFRSDASPRTWLYRIAYNACLDRLDRDRRSAGLASEGPGSEAGPESAAVSAADTAAVRAALAALGEDDRRLLILMMDGALGYAELAEVVGCPAGAIRMRVSRARRRLREALGPLMEDGHERV